MDTATKTLRGGDKVTCNDHPGRLPLVTGRDVSGSIGGGIVGVQGSELRSAMNAECETCGSIFRGVDRSEDGEPEIPGRACADKTCGAWICPAGCQELSFSCDGCSGVFCEEHQINFQGLRVCIACLQDALESNEPECECVPTVADLFDPRSCDLHNEPVGLQPATEAGHGQGAPSPSVGFWHPGPHCAVRDARDGRTADAQLSSATSL